MKRRPNDHGMSLIELVVAMAIFALIAIMGVQSLSAMLRQRDHLVAMDVQTTQLGRTVAMLRNDMSAVVPMLFFPPDRGAPKSALQNATDGVFSLSTGGQPSFPGGGRFHRVAWRLDSEEQSLHRLVWSTLIPADATALQPESTILSGVTGLAMRSYWPDVGWVDGLSNLNADPAEFTLDGDAAVDAPEVYSDTIPLALEVTITTLDHGDITLLESLR